MPVLDKADKNKCEEYEKFVRNSPFTHAMQAPAWAKVKNNWISEYVYLEEDGKITAAMSVLGIKAVDDKTFLYAPRGPVSDFYDVETTKKLIEEARPLFEKHNAFLLRLDPCVKDDKELVKKYRDAGFTFRSDETEIHSFSNPRYEIMLTLKGKTEEDLMAGFNSMTRRHIRASYKNGVTSEWGRSQAEIDRFFEHHKTMAERQGITYRPKEYFERLVEAFPEIRIYTSEYEGKSIAAMIGLPYGDKMWYIYGGTETMRGSKVSPGYLLIWNLIQWGVELGLDYFNMGGTYSLDMEDGLFFFKHGFCKADEPFVWIGELDVVLDKEAYKEFLSK